MKRKLLSILLLLTAFWMTLTTQLFPQSRAQETVQLPILMYHSVLRQDNGNEYCISVERLESDLLWLKSHGYETILTADLTNYVQNGTPLPEKPVMLTLDDGYLNGLTDVLPLLEQYNMKAVISVVGSYTEQSVAEHDPDPRYAYLTWEDSSALAASGRVEIGNHTYALHSLKGRKGAGRLKGEAEGSYQSMLREDLTHLQQLLETNCGLTPTAFAWPYGMYSDSGLPVLKELGFQTAFTCEEHINCLTGDSEELFHLGRFHRASGWTTEDFMVKVGLQ